MNTSLRQISKQLLIGGTLLIWLIKFVIRPLHLLDGPAHFLWGIAPNLFGSFLVPFAAYWLFSGKNYWVARLFRMESVNELRQVCLLSFGMLVCNEYLQMIPFFGRTFDYFDIFFSSIGLLTAYLVFIRLQARSEAKQSIQLD